MENQYFSYYNYIFKNAPRGTQTILAKGMNYARWSILIIVKHLIKEIMNHPSNMAYTNKDWKPLFSNHKNAHVVFIGQAPGIKAQESNMSWSDASGRTLQTWLGISQEQFYDEKIIALVPMDFYYPGKGKTGDLPPRKDFANLWHERVFAEMPNLKLKILIGQYSQRYYLGDQNKKNLTETVRNYKEYLKDGFFPIPHPSPRNNIWLRKNPWFEKYIIPELQKNVKKYFD